MKIAYAGSFDPITNGHLHIIDKAIAIVPDVELVILVANNVDKKHRFSVDDRVEMIRKEIGSELKIEVRVLPSDRYAVEYAKSIGCNAMIRGIRTEKDFQDESGIYNANKIICPLMETLYIMPNINLSTVSSSLVMGLVGPIGWMDAVKQLVPNSAFMQICKYYCFKAADANIFTGDLSCYDKMPYHNWVHIAYCITEFKRLGYHHTDLVKGILLHDAVNPNNKEELRKFSFYDINAYDLNFVWEAVSATDHEYINENVLTSYQKLIHDIDLSVLSFRPSKYLQYVKKITKEYVEVKGIPYEMFKQGRKEFIQSILKKDHIFFTSQYSEANARENLLRELKDYE